MGGFVLLDSIWGKKSRQDSGGHGRLSYREGEGAF